MNQGILIWARLFATVASAALLPSCMMDDEQEGPDGSDCTGGADGGPSVGGTMGETPEVTGLQVLTDDGPALPDLSCLGVHMTPTGGKQESTTLDARAFGSLDEMGNPIVVPGLEVQVFANNQIPVEETCEEGCSLATDNGDGSYEFLSAAGSWNAYRVIERSAGDLGPATLRTMEVNFVPRPEEGFNTIFEPVFDGLHAALSIPRDSEAGLLGGRVLDCQGRYVEGARVSVRDQHGNAIPTSDTTRPVYIDTMGPDASLERTTWTGQWSFTNVPVGEGSVVVEARSENDILVGCEVIPVGPSAMSVVRVLPLRGDAASVCDH